MLIVWPSPNSLPVKGELLLPNGMKPPVHGSVALASISPPKAYQPVKFPLMPCKSLPVVLLAKPRLVMTLMLMTEPLGPYMTEKLSPAGKYTGALM